MPKYIKQATRERIIQAALDAFDKLDFHQATVRDIAKKSGIAIGSMYQHFNSKEELAEAISIEKVRQILIGLEEHFLGVRGTLNRLRKMTWYYLNFYEHNPGVAWILHISTSMKSWRDSTEGWKKIQETGQLLMNILKEGQENGDVRRDINLRLAIRIYFGSMNYIVETWLVQDRSYPLTSWSDDLTDYFYGFVRTNTAQDPPFKCQYVEALKYLSMQFTESHNNKVRSAQDICSSTPPQ
jgi:TetR/AcrR family fatty acid metabolism transcriptional regulator